MALLIRHDIFGSRFFVIHLPDIHIIVRRRRFVIRLLDHVLSLDTIGALDIDFIVVSIRIHFHAKSTLPAAFELRIKPAVLCTWVQRMGTDRTTEKVGECFFHRRIILTHLFMCVISGCDRGVDLTIRICECHRVCDPVLFVGSQDDLIELELTVHCSRVEIIGVEILAIRIFLIGSMQAHGAVSEPRLEVFLDQRDCLRYSFARDAVHQLAELRHPAVTVFRGFRRSRGADGIAAVIVGRVSIGCGRIFCGGRIRRSSCGICFRGCGSGCRCIVFHGCRKIIRFFLIFLFAAGRK